VRQSCADPHALIVPGTVDAGRRRINAAGMTKLCLASTLFVSLLAGSALADEAKKAAPAKPAPAAKPVTVKLTDAKGKSIGTAKLSADPGGVKITLAVKGLTPGDHAIHVHETAKCDAPDFKSAGGHFNPEHKQHGTANPEGPHAGDMPNFTADAKGASTASLVAAKLTLDDGPHSVFTGGGTALVIHDKADDLKTDPAGAAGDRIACGLIKK
jgi:Cu-Zn family superoxide dismutase